MERRCRTTPQPNNKILPTRAAMIANRGVPSTAFSGSLSPAPTGRWNTAQGKPRLGKGRPFRAVHRSRTEAILLHRTLRLKRAGGLRVENGKKMHLRAWPERGIHPAGTSLPSNASDFIARARRSDVPADLEVRGPIESSPAFNHA
jgi:hypothetical protein